MSESSSSDYTEKERCNNETIVTASSLTSSDRNIDNSSNTQHNLHSQYFESKEWKVDNSSDLYRVRDWGEHYFSINELGHVVVRSEPNGPCCDLFELTKSLEQRGIDAPILFRFDGIIRNRTRKLQDAFQKALADYGYHGTYTVAFPLKVNPQGHVVEAIRKSGVHQPIGLEVGSKPELLAVLSLQWEPNSLLLCNGYKDDEYIELALMARKLGRRSIIIIEQFYELDKVLAIAERLHVEAELGVRIKPSSKSAGLWSASSGDKAKFGLTTTQILKLLTLLESRNKLGWLSLLHFHIGSQIPAIHTYRKVLKEATRMYVELAKRCPSMSLLDVGGGLGVDYDGSSSNFESSMNYSVQEYADSIVAAVYEACEEAGVRHPDLVSESGRALVAHHAILVTEVIDVAPGINGTPPPEECPFDDDLLQRLHELYTGVVLKNFQETLNEMLGLREDIIEHFVQGKLGIEERAYAEQVLKYLSQKLVNLSQNLRYIPDELKSLEDTLRDTYFCNFSLFQSMLDSWAIDQLFPIMPIQRLGERPKRRATLADLTCDSDGEISRFIDLRDVNNYLLCHEPRWDEGGYYIGVFLVGAYQEILGGLHNLFGDTNVVHVDVAPDGSVEINEIVQGDTIREVLDYVEYTVPTLTSQFRLSLELAIRQGAITLEESAQFQRKYRQVLDGYTYLVR
jgi:arginine decarboxylase